MAEYISRETLLKAVEKMDRLDKESTPYEYNKEGYILLIESAPTADVAEVKHGEWKESDIVYYRPHCSLCDYEHFVGAFYQYSTNYCPRCGAKMDGGKEE